MVMDVIIIIIGPLFCLFINPENCALNAGLLRIHCTERHLNE